MHRQPQGWVALLTLAAMGAAAIGGPIAAESGRNVAAEPLHAEPGPNVAAQPLHKIRFLEWQTFDMQVGMPSDKVLAVAIDEQRVWAGTESGLALIENGRVRVIDRGERLPFPVVTALSVAPGGDLWIGTMGGLGRLSGGQFESFTQLDSGLASDVVYGVAAGESDVWVATAAGLSRYRVGQQTWEIYDTTNTLMHEPWCYAVALDAEDVYVAVWGGGVIVREHRSGTFREHRDPDGEMEIDLFRDDGLLHDVTSAIALSNDVMWVGTYFGLGRYENRRWQSYSIADSGLVGDFINVLAARDGAVWIGTDQGLGRFDSHTWQAWHRTDDGVELRTTGPDGTSRRQRVSSGPASNTIYGIAIGSGDIWLATAAGISRGTWRRTGPPGPAPLSQPTTIRGVHP